MTARRTLLAAQTTAASLQGLTPMKWISHAGRPVGGAPWCATRHKQ